jgi:hypothetical protein
MKFSSYVFMLIRSYLLSYKPRYTRGTKDCMDRTTNDSFDDLTTEYDSLSYAGKRDKYSLGLLSQMVDNTDHNISLDLKRFERALIRVCEKKGTPYAKEKSRNFYRLFKLLQNEYSQKEISKELNITVAGVGAMINRLGAKINKFEKVGRID